MPIPIKAPGEVAHLREAGLLLARTLRALADAARPGVTTRELADLAHALFTAAGAIPILRGYAVDGAPAFPASASFCVNDEVVHAVPSDRLLRPGDILTIDAALSTADAHGTRRCADAATTIGIGPPDPRRARVAAAAATALAAALAHLRPGVRWSTVSEAVGASARATGCLLLPGFAGHGIGLALHEPPRLPFDHPLPPAVDLTLRPGMVLTIEPILIEGSAALPVVTLDDAWTVLTADRSPAAHEERTILITRTGHEVLTPL